MSKINITLLLQNFFNKHPDIKESRNKGLINRRALAQFIIKNEALNSNYMDAVLTALRRFPEEKANTSELDFAEEIKLSTKNGIVIIYLEKSPEVFKKISQLLQLINFNKNETLKIVLGTSSVKIFVDENNLNKVKDIFPHKEIISNYKHISELTLLFPEKARMTKGNLAYITAALAVNNINIIELLTGRPEIIFYFNEKDLLKAYETINQLKKY